MDIDSIIRVLPKPNYEVKPVPPTLTEAQREKALSYNYELRVKYIHGALCKEFPEVAGGVGDFPVSERLTVWAEVLTEPEERIYLEAAKVRAVSHEQRPPQYVTLGLTDIDYFETNASLTALRETNKEIEREVSSADFAALSPTEKKARLTELLKQRDASLHPLVFILTLNVDDLDKMSKRKLRLLHSKGKHQEARQAGRELLIKLQKSAIADYRKSKENNVEFDKSNFRTFS